MRIAVTAASGQLGSSIIKQLVEKIGQENVIGIARKPDKAKHLGVEIRKGDYNSKADFDTALIGIDVVLIVSGMDHPDKRIGQHRNIINAAKEAGVRKIVYTSIYGAEEGNAFSPIVKSNRQTEEDIKNSGLQWAIGRNGIYIEPDLEYIETYKKDGGIINCAADGKCGYTSRNELAYAYFKLLTEDSLQGEIYNLFGETITQNQLASSINKAYILNLEYRSISIDAYRKERQAALGDFLGTVIAGIYEGIRMGEYDGNSDYTNVTNRAHHSIEEMISEFKSF